MSQKRNPPGLITVHQYGNDISNLFSILSLTIVKSNFRLITMTILLYVLCPIFAGEKK